MLRRIWEATFRTALEAAAAKCGSDISGLQFEGCTTDQTWGDRCGLVFWGAAPDVNERAAKFFEKWASRNLRKLGAVGGYDAQESISFAGAMYFTRYSNGAQGWHRRGGTTVVPEQGSVTRYEPSVLGAAWENVCEEVRHGFATSYVYYPCAD